MTKTLTKGDLRKFTGSEHWYRHALNRKVVFTDGVKHVADTAGAYWLIDEIALAQRGYRRVAAEAFQCWRLTVRTDQTAVLVCEDGNGNAVLRKQLTYTDFPLDEIEIFFSNSTIYLPSEN